MSDENIRVSISSARLEDLDGILALERSGFAETEQWSRRSWQGELLGERRTVLVARAHQIIGVIALHTVGEAADLQRLVVSPRQRRQGVGAALVRAGLDAVRHLGARTVTLEVGYHNEPAIALYQLMGFEQRAVREDYYGPGQHALILKLYNLQQAAGNESQP
ncbi:MAG: GNAT family N-acetyltransferase [Propionibacteriaceae bacterium]|nr:GNAT family N-acetyltransferase [Propionibacteriaceae bacterium]